MQQQKGASEPASGSNRSYASFFVYADGDSDLSVAVGKGKGATRNYMVASAGSSSLPFPSSVTVPLGSSSLPLPSSVTVPLGSSSLPIVPSVTVPLGSSSLPVLSSSLVLSSFIGLTCQAGAGLIDTGAQTAVIGKPAFAAMEAALKSKEKKSKGQEGLVLDQDVPLLLPIGMLRKLGMVLDLQRVRCRWSKLNKDAKLIVEPSGHISSCSNQVCMCGTACCLKLEEQVVLLREPHLRCVMLGKQAAKLLSEKVRGLSWKSSNVETSLGAPSTSSSCVREHVPLVQGFPRECGDRYDDGHPARGNQTQAGKTSAASTSGRVANAASCDSWASCGRAPQQKPGKDDVNAVTQVVRAHGAKHESTQQRKNMLVDVCQLRESLGENGVCTNGTEPARNYGCWETQSTSLRGSPEQLCAVGTPGVRGSWERYAPAAAALLSVAAPTGATQGAEQAAASIFCSNIAEHSSISINGSSSNAISSTGTTRGVLHVRRGGADSGLDSRPEKRLSLVHRLEQEIKSMSMPARRRFVEEKTTQSPTERFALLGLFTRQGGTGITK
eukprot:6491261-Amphidinium_carterae.1